MRKPLATHVPVAAILFAFFLAVPMNGCSGGAGDEAVRRGATGRPEAFPSVREFEDPGEASKAAGFKIRTPGYSSGGKLECIRLVWLTPERRYAELAYSNELAITVTPLDVTMGFDRAMAEHEQCIRALPRHLQTNEQPEPVEVAGHRGILWTYRNGPVIEKRPETGVPSFHPPYLMWWDGELQYRLSVDDPEMFESGLEKGKRKLLRIADSIY